MPWGPGTPHQGFPVVDGIGQLCGVITPRHLDARKSAQGDTVRDQIKQPSVVVFEDFTLREAADPMAMHNIGRLPVIDRHQPKKLVGFITRSDQLNAHQKRLMDLHDRR